MPYLGVKSAYQMIAHSDLESLVPEEKFDSYVTISQSFGIAP